MTGSLDRRERLLVPRHVAAAVVSLVLVAACTAPVVPSPSPSPSPTSTASSSASPATTSSSASAAASPTTGPSSSPTSTPVASPSAAAGADCGPGDLTMTGGPWGGAAGSRGADVKVTARATACRLPAHPVVAMADSSGKDLIHSTLPLTDDGPLLEPGASRMFTFRVGNWCDRTARLPLQAVGLVASGAIEIRGLVMTADLLPPCNGPGQPADIEASDWE